MDPRNAITATLAASTALVVAFGLGWALAPGRTDGPGGPGGTPGLGGVTPVAYPAASGLTAPESCQALLDSFIERGLEEVGPYGWGGGPIAMLDTAGAGDASASAEASTPLSQARSQRATSSDTGTNVQEEGVDEPDVVKVAGPLLVRMEDEVLRTYDVAGAAPTEIGELDLSELVDGSYAREPGTSPIELLLVGDRVVALAGHEWMPTTNVGVVDLADPTDPTLVSTTEITGALDQSRLHGDVLRLVVRRGLPELDFRTPDGTLGQITALLRNRALVRATTLSDWLPTVGGEPVDCDSIAIPADGPLGSTAVLAFDPSSIAEGQPVTVTSAGVATDTETSYFSTDRFYLTTGTDRFFDCGWEPCGRIAAPDDAPTRVHAFRIGDLSTTYVASGEVDGSVRDRWSMDSVDGVLRLALGPDWRTGNFSSVVTMVEEGDELVEAGRVDGLGVDEEIKSVRWFDDLAIVVTFRQTYPLYAIDLTDDRAPRLLGELKIPGFSEYLHPLGGMRMLGIGQDADPRTGQTRGAQASLFDVTDLTDPRQIDVVTWPKNTVAGVASDPRQFTWLPDQRIALTVVSKGWTGSTGWVAVMRLGGGRVRSELVEVEHGVDVAQVRTVPLASGKVALVTADDVSFLDL